MKENILTNTKIHVKNEEESIKVQELAFSLGYSWYSAGTKPTFTKDAYLFFSRKGLDITRCDSFGFFETHENKLITFNELFPMENKTKCIVLGQENEPKKELKPIEFVDFLNIDKTFESTSTLNPKAFKNIELVSRYSALFDIMLAYNEFRDSGGCLFLGHWNDGIV